MSKKGDMMAALEHRQPERAVPLWELEFHLWDQWSGKHVVLGREFEGLTSAQQQERALRANAEIIIEVSQEIGFAAVYVPSSYWEVAPGHLAYYVLPEAARWEQIRLLGELCPPDLLLVGGTGGIISPPSGAGYQEFAYKLYDAPEEIDQWARAARDGAVKAGKRLRDLGVKIAVCSADIADNHGPYFTPAQMQRFVLPYLHDWGENMRQLGLYSILHTDGMLYPILDDLANSGIDAIQAIDPIAGMDMARTKEMAGNRLCLCGNVDCGVLQFGPPERIYETVRELIIQCKPGGCFVLGGSNVIFPEIPKEHYAAMLKAWRDHGSYLPGIENRKSRIESNN
jgi:uroporphyrinogen decarboxylase